MIAQAAWGIAAGLMCIGAFTAWRRVQNSDRAVQLLLWISAALTLIALASTLLDSSSASTWPSAFVALLILAGGVVYRMRGLALTPGALLATGLLLAYIAFAPPTSTPLNLSDGIVALTCVTVLPTFDMVARTFRNQSLRFNASIALWFGLSLALLTTATLNLIQHGLWLEGNSGTVALLVAWLAAAGAMLLRRSRLQAILIFVATCALVAQAWHVLN